MRILLDECLPAELAAELTGHEVRTVQEAGWSSVDNGALLQRAATKFDIFITIDKHIERTHKLPSSLAVRVPEILTASVPKILTEIGRAHV